MDFNDYGRRVIRAMFFKKAFKSGHYDLAEHYLRSNIDDFLPNELDSVKTFLKLYYHHSSVGPEYNNANRLLDTLRELGQERIRNEFIR